MNDIEKISIETGCLKYYIAKGIALASFIQARCLELGKGQIVDNKDAKELAKSYYKRVY